MLKEETEEGHDATVAERRDRVFSRVPSRLGSHNGDRRASERSFMQPPYRRAYVYTCACAFV